MAHDQRTSMDHLASLHDRCCRAFEALLDALSPPTHGQSAGCLSREMVESEFDKHMLWAANVGAMHRGERYEVSLDYRLRASPFYRDRVVSFLTTLEQKVLQAAALLVDGVSTTEEKFAEMEIDASESNEDEDMDDVDSDASSWSMNEDRNDPEGSRQVTFEDNASAQHPLHPDTGELSQIQTMIRFLLTTLYKLPIRRPAALERLKTRLSGTASDFQHFDIMFVRDAFPCLESSIIARLGRLVSLRRQILFYRQDHHHHLQAQSLDQERSILNQQASPRSQLPQHTGLIGTTTSEGAPSVSTAQQTDSQQPSWLSKATTHRRMESEENFLYPPSIAPSDTSRASSYAAHNLRIEMPPRPTDRHGKLTHFLCPYCSITQHIKSENAWRKHVFDDLQPYVCTYSGCEYQDHFFVTRNQWFQHELQEHRLAWHCNDDRHDEHSSQDEFICHMNTYHNVSFSSEEVNSLSSMFRRSTRSLAGTCNFCLRPSKNLRSHVARHLQRIALFALPRTNEIANSNSDRAQESHVTRSLQEAASDMGSEHSSEMSISVTSNKDWVDKEQSTDQPDSQAEEEDTVAAIPDSGDPEWHLITDKFDLVDTSQCEILLAKLKERSDGDVWPIIHELGLELKRLENWGLTTEVEKILYKLRGAIRQVRQTNNELGKDPIERYFWQLFVVNYDLVSFIENHGEQLKRLNLLSPALRLDRTSLAHQEPDPLTVKAVLQNDVDANAFDHRIGVVPWYEFLKRIWELRDTADDYRRERWFEVVKLMVSHGAIIHIPDIGPSLQSTLEDIFGLQRLTELMDIPRPRREKKVSWDPEEHKLHEVVELSEEQQLDQAIWLSLQQADNQNKQKRENAESLESDSEDEEELMRRAIDLSLQADE